MRSASALPDPSSDPPPDPASTAPAAAAAASSPSEGAIPWPTVGLAFASMFFMMGTRTSFAVLYPAMVADLEWSVADITGAYSTGLLLYALIAIPAGVAVDRFGCRLMLVGGAVLVTVGLIGSALATELWHFYVAYMLTAGLGTAGIGFITLVKMVSMRAGARFATAFGLAFMGQGFGSLLVSPAVQWVVDAAGWRAATLLYAVALGAILVPLAALLAPGPERTGPSGAHESAGGATPVFSVVFLIFFLANAGLGFQMLVPTHQVAYLLDLGFAATLAASAAGAWGALMSVGSVGGGWIVDRWGVARVLVVALALLSLGTVALVVSTPAALWLVVLYVLAGGLGRGLLGVTLGAAQTRAFAGPRLGRMTGVLDLGFGGGAFFGPWITAVLHDQVGTFALGFLATIPASLLVTAGTVIASRRDRR